MSQITEEVKSFILDNFMFGQDADELEAEDSLMEKGIIDSTGVLELVGFLERTFDIDVEDEELIPDNLDSIGNITRYVERKAR
jgi:acyl carrier protein